MIDPAGYGALIKKAQPDYVEVKAYMHLGYSRYRLPREAMPTHGEVLAFAREVADAAGYRQAMDVELSRVVLAQQGRPGFTARVNCLRRKSLVSVA